jgi:hypothetical protein
MVPREPVKSIGRPRGSIIAAFAVVAVALLPRAATATRPLSSAFVTPMASLPPYVAPAIPGTGSSRRSDADRTPGQEDKPIDYDTPRYEAAGFPIVGGTSDIGVMGGGVFTLTRFDGGVRPYRWNMDAVASASAKDGPNGTEIAQQSYLWQLDVPGLAGGNVRLNPAV